MEVSMTRWKLSSKQWDALDELRFLTRDAKVFRNATIILLSAGLHARNRGWPFSYRIKQLLIQSRSRLLERLLVHQRPGVKTFRYWQEGPDYDRNFTMPSTVLAAIDYLHHNPVRREFVPRAVDWKWSSARYYLHDPPQPYAGLPTVHSLPAEWLNEPD
jgi:hypothetical protein